MRQTQVNSDYFHKVVDCQWSCPAHTPVPEYIRLITEGRYTDAYMVNWYSNLFPGILGRVCDRPCEPACRRGRVDETPVAICRLKRVTADFKDDNEIEKRLPAIPTKKNGKRIALIGAGPASLTVANDLLPYGYEISLFEKEARAGGAMFTQVPRFRLPLSVLDEEVERITKRGVLCHFNHEVKSLKALIDTFNAVFVGTGAPQGRSLKIAGAENARDNILVGVEFLASVSFEYRKSLPEKILVIGGGNTAIDCARTSFRLGAKSVQMIAPESYEEMLASPWEKEDAEREVVQIQNHLLPQEFISENGKLKAVRFQKLKRCYNSEKKWDPIPSGEPDVMIPCDLVITAIGQDLAFPFIDSASNIEFEKNKVKVHPVSFQSSNPKVFFGGDAAFGPRNIIWAVAQGHEAAISIHKFCEHQNTEERPAKGMTLLSQRMGLNQWTYDNGFDESSRKAVPHHPVPACKTQLNLEVELGYDVKLALEESKRCLNCDVQTVFNAELCIECDACVDICPTQCLSIVVDPNVINPVMPRTEGPSGHLIIKEELESFKKSLKSYPKNKTQDLFLSSVPQTHRLMVKDENLCLHCGLCAERCPTAAWDMKKFTLANA